MSKEKTDRVEDHLAKARYHITRAFQLANAYDLVSDLQKQFKELNDFLSNNVDAIQDKVELIPRKQTPVIETKRLEGIELQKKLVDTIMEDAANEDDILRNNIEQKRALMLAQNREPIMENLTLEEGMAPKQISADEGSIIIDQMNQAKLLLEQQKIANLKRERNLPVTIEQPKKRLERLNIEEKEQILKAIYDMAVKSVSQNFQGSQEELDEKIRIEADRLLTEYNNDTD